LPALNQGQSEKSDWLFLLLGNPFHFAAQDDPFSLFALHAKSESSTAKTIAMVPALHFCRILAAPVNLVRRKYDSSLSGGLIDDRHSLELSDLRTRDFLDNAGDIFEPGQQFVAGILAVDGYKEYFEIEPFRDCFVVIVLCLCLILVAAFNPVLHLLSNHCFSDVLIVGRALTRQSAPLASRDRSEHE
jgi:hypothetical protein